MSFVTVIRKSDCNDPSQKYLHGPFSIRNRIKLRYQVVARTAVVHVTTTSARLSYGFNVNNESSGYCHMHTDIFPGQGALWFVWLCLLACDANNLMDADDDRKMLTATHDINVCIQLSHRKASRRRTHGRHGLL